MSPQALGLDVDRHTFDRVKSQYDAGGPKQRARLIAAGGIVGKTARRIDEAYRKTDGRKAVPGIDVILKAKQGEARGEISFDDLIPKPTGNPSRTYAAAAPLSIAAGPAGGLKPSPSPAPYPPGPPRSFLPNAAIEKARLGGGLKPEEFRGILNGLELGAFADPKGVRDKVAPVLSKEGREAVEQAMLTAKLRAQHRGRSVLPLPDGGRAFVQGAVDAVSMGLARPRVNPTGNAKIDRMMMAAGRAQELEARQLREEHPLAELGGQLAGSALLGGGVSRALRIPAEITVGDKIFDPRPFARETARRTTAQRLGEQGKNTVSAAPGMGQTGNDLRFSRQPSKQGDERVAKGVSNHSLDYLLEAANKEYNDSGISVAVRSWEKHSGRSGGTFQLLTGNVAEKNEAARTFVRQVLTNPATVRTELPRGGIEYRLPNGQGIRFDADGSLSGFLDPKR